MNSEHWKPFSDIANDKRLNPARVKRGDEFDIIAVMYVQGESRSYKLYGYDKSEHLVVDFDDETVYTLESFGKEYYYINLDAMDYGA